MTANSQALHELADDIERDGAEQPLFRMDSYIENYGKLQPMCNTAACIAGYALFKWDRERFLACAVYPYGGFGHEEEQFVQDRLGLTGSQVNGMFTPNINFDLITKEVAAAMLRWLADHPRASGFALLQGWKSMIQKTKLEETV